MSTLRQDRTTRQWVIVAPDRGRRPHDLRRPPGGPGSAALCPFCPGQERATPPELLRIADPGGDGWAVRVIPNNFPALAGRGDPRRWQAGPLFREMDGVGAHEVIVESPKHDRAIAGMADDEVLRVLHAYAARYQALHGDERIECIVIFKNHRERAGTSLAHPHSQLVATPVAPLTIRRKYEVAVDYYDDTGRCLYGDVVAAEVAAGVRVVLQTDRFVVFHPFASRVPFETWIAPRQEQASFGHASPEDLAALAPVLRRTLKALHQGLGDPAFNYIVHSAPTKDERRHYYLWHLQILPRIAAIAGFELGSGIWITTWRPEESATLMRSWME